NYQPNFFVSAGVPLLLTLLFGEMIPKSIAFKNKEKAAKFLSFFIFYIAVLLKPIATIFLFFTRNLSKALFFYLKKPSPLTIGELKEALHAYKEGGVMEREEAKIVRGYLNLEEDRVKELMCAKEDIIFFDLAKSESELADLFVQKGCTKVVVCQGGLEHVLGIISAHRYFLHQDKIKNLVDIIPFLEKVRFVSESMRCKALLAQFYACNESLVLVVDEYGVITGLITLEDIVESVIGEVSDARDTVNHYTRASQDIIITSGKFELVEFERVFDVHLESLGNMATIGGFLIEQAGDIPQAGFKLQKQGFLFHVLAADSNRIRRVYIKRVKTVNKKKRRLRFFRNG
ncbi:hypothetical protein COB21_00240, partial [Candidatus Aerophobetes bacterium]